MRTLRSRVVLARIFVLLPALIFSGGLSSCASSQPDYFNPSQSSVAARTMQARVYSSVDEGDVMSAAAAVLQDMGYSIDAVESQLGVISASKRADATNRLEAFGSLTFDSMKCVFTFLIGCDGERYGGIDDVQDVRLTMVSMPKGNGDVTVRVTIQRRIYDKRGRLSEQSTISDAAVYESLFAKLSKAVFLEEQGI
jgi:hypothetical protein